MCVSRRYIGINSGQLGMCVCVQSGEPQRLTSIRSTALLSCGSEVSDHRLTLAVTSDDQWRVEVARRSARGRNEDSC